MPILFIVFRFMNYKLDIYLNMHNSTSVFSIDLISDTIQSEIPHFWNLYQFAIVSFVKGCRDILTLYPLNILIILATIYWFFLKIINRLYQNNKQSIYYWPNPHIERYDRHLKNFRKDIRDLKSETFNMQRKIESMHSEDE